MKKQLVSLTCLSLFLSAIPCEAALQLKNGSLVSVKEQASLSVDEHYQLGLKALEASNWREAERQFLIITQNFPKSELYGEAIYHLGIAYYQQTEYDFANDTFNLYLKCPNNPQNFENAIGYKLAIANHFKNGAYRRFFGTKQLPKLAPGRGLANTIFEEVICALPTHEFAAQALFEKGKICWEDLEYREAVEAFQTLIRRFPKHELTPEAYMAINNVYLEQSEFEFQNPDLLDLAQINLRRFKAEFSRDERVATAEEKVNKIREVYAKGLYETGQFYERTCRPNASIIYYIKAIRQFPLTEIAQLCKKRLQILQPEAIEIAETVVKQIP